jgi:hypothetical protein
MIREKNKIGLWGIHERIFLVEKCHGLFAVRGFMNFYADDLRHRQRFFETFHLSGVILYGEDFDSMFDGSAHNPLPIFLVEIDGPRFGTVKCGSMISTAIECGGFSGFSVKSPLRLRKFQLMRDSAPGPERKSGCLRKIRKPEKGRIDQVWTVHQVEVMAFYVRKLQEKSRA